MESRITAVLKRLEEQSQLEKSKSVDVLLEDRMLAITEETGRFYNILLESSGARNVLEIGTSTGYSALWFADAIRGRGGKITTIDQSPSKIGRARENFEEAGVSDMIVTVEGAAMDVLSSMGESGKVFDFVFLDADKENCAAYFDLVFPMLNKGGLVGTDNMLYPEKYRGQMKEFADHIRMYPNAKTVTLNIGNGQELTLKVRQ